LGALLPLISVTAGAALGLGLRLILFVLGALLMRGLALFAAEVVGWLPSADPVYTRAALWSLSDLRLQGLSLGGLGLARVAIEPGGPVLARMLASGVANAGALGIGLLLVRSGWIRRNARLVLVGVGIQAQVAAAVIDAQPSLTEIESTGLAFAANALLPRLAPRGATVSDAVTGASPPLLVAALVALALLVAYLPGGLLLFARRRARTASLTTALCVVLSSAACAGVWPSGPVQVYPAERIAAASAPAGVPAPQAPQIVSATLRAAPPAEARAAPLALVRDQWYLERASSQPAPPSHVEVNVDGSGAAQLLVNGQPQVIRGMGLNTQYTQTLTPPQRAARLDSDFAALRSMGVNTVLGWDPSEFDSVLLDAAEDHGLGVVMPFDIDPATDFTDPGIRAQLTRQVLDWVKTYRAHPALRMWGIGNEVLHKIVHPVWLGGPQDAVRVQQARAFVDWTIETADAVHALDPDHPVTYRDAEDAFANWMVEGLHRHGLPEARMWFLWGVNCYTNRLDQIEANWPNVGMESPMWVSEFAPGGLAIPDRPDGFSSMWATIRQHAAWTLGGAAYAWTRNGPEGVDRNLGLTDDGTPVDGKSLERLAQLYRAESN
jgi:hypothetical protein